MKYADDAYTTLASDMSAVATTASVVSATPFPAISGDEWFPITLERLSDGAKETVKVTGVSGTDFALSRSYYDDTPLAFSAGDRVSIRVGEAVLDGVYSDLRTEAKATAHGLVGDDSADNADALQTAVTWVVANNLGTVRVTPGTYKLTADSTPLVTPPENCTVEGALGAKIRVDSSTTSSKVDFALSNNNTTIKNLAIEHDGPSGETGQVFALEADGITLSGLDIDTNHTAGFNHAVNAFQFTNNNAANVTITNNTIHDVNRVMLRSNSTTGTLENLRFSQNHCYNLCEGGVQFNFPATGINGVFVTENYFDDFLTGTERIFMGGASVQQGIFSGNITTGTCKESFHFEEQGRDILVTNNVAAADGKGIFMIDNNVGDGSTYYRPERVTVAHNIFNNTGTTKTNIGLYAPGDAFGGVAVDNLLFVNNQLHNYDQGMVIDRNVYQIQGNLIDGCSVAIRGPSLNPTIRDNIIKDCDTGFEISTRGGLAGPQTFNNVTTVATSDGGELCGLTGFILNSETDVPLPTGFTNVDVGIEVGSVMYGEMICHVYISSVAYQYRHSTIDYDGTTLTDTENRRKGLGSITLSSFVNNSGQLAIRFNNLSGAPVTLDNFSLEFRGLWVSST
jgi:hypothetical protein